MANELVALAEVAADAVDKLAITPAQRLHEAIARRVFGSTPASDSSRVIHDGVALAAYSTLRLAVGGAAGLLGVAARALAPDAEVRPLSRSPRGRFLVGALNGVRGDLLAATGSALAIEMAVRDDGADVACTRDAVRSAFPAATPRLAVFLHGLAETEEWWLRRRRDADGVERRPFGARLRDDAGLTPVYVRYNTGLHVGESGAALASLLDALCAAWPVAVEELVLVGHSMGGLVVRAACHRGAACGHSWPHLAGNVVTLGSPHHGAPIAKGIHAAASALRMVPEASPLADILDLRSAGIRDMRFGALDEARSDVPLLPGCRHTFITATVTRDQAHPLGWLLGDLLVRTESAGGRCRQRTIPLPPESVVHLGGLNHFDLLDHDAVYDVLRGVLAARR